MAEAWLLQRRRHAGRLGAGPPAGRAPRAHVPVATVGALAPARADRLAARRSVSRHRAPRSCRSGRRNSRSIRAPSASPTTSSASATGRSATRRSSGSSSARPISALQRRGRPPVPRAVPLADGHRVRTDRPARRGDVGTAPGRAPRHGGRRRRRAGAGLRQPGQRRPDASPARPGAGAGRARRRAARARGHGPRPRGGPRLARPDLRADRRPAPRRNGRFGARSTSAARSSSTRPRARCSTRSRRFTWCAASHDEAGSVPADRRARRYGTYGLQASRWYEWSVRLLTARLALRRGQRADALQQATEHLDVRRRPAGRGHPGGTARRRGAVVRGAGGRSRATAGQGRRAPRPADDTGLVGRVSPAARARIHVRRGRSPTPTTTSRRARACSTCSASNTRPPQPAGARPALGPGRCAFGRRAPLAGRARGVRVDGRRGPTSRMRGRTPCFAAPASASGAVPARRPVRPTT